MSFLRGIGELFTGSRPKQGYTTDILKEQMPLFQQLLASLQGSGAGGAYGSAADYYRDLLSPDSQTAESMFQPEMRQFHENIIPSLAEQFAGMGSGGLSSSGFRNAAVNAGTDLSERLGAIRAGLRSQGAQGLTQLGGMGLTPHKQNYYKTGQPGLLQYAAQGIGQAIPGYLSGGGGLGQSFMKSLGGF